MSNEKLTNSQSDTQGGVKQFNLVIGESADIIGQYGFWEANKFIAINSAVMFQSFFYANFNLGGKTVIFGMNWCADYSRELGVYNQLSGDNHKNTMTFRIIFISLIDPVKITSFHKSNKSRYIFWYDSTSIASAFNLSALRLISSISCSSVILSLTAGTGVKAIIVLPTGISRGMSIVIRRLAGTSIVCSIVIRKI